MKLTLADNFRDHWEAILPGLVWCLEKQKEGMRPEDVFADLRAGQSMLFLSDDGFMLLKQEFDGGQNKILLVWFAHSNTGKSVTAYYMGELEEIAKVLKCKTIEYADPTWRRGYERVAPEGWDAKYVRWSKKVGE